MDGIVQSGNELRESRSRGSPEIFQRYGGNGADARCGIPEQLCQRWHCRRGWRADLRESTRSRPSNIRGFVRESLREQWNGLYRVRTKISDGAKYTGAILRRAV